MIRWFSITTDNKFLNGCVGFEPTLATDYRNIKVTALDGTALWEGVPKLPGDSGEVKDVKV